MIIEGKHADVGQGIFVSDIQEGSAADKVTIAFSVCVCVSFSRFLRCVSSFVRLALKSGK